MIPGTPETIKCPACEKLQQRQTLRSGNTFGAIYYSDGKYYAPMLPEYPYYVKCPACGVFFKITTTVIIKTMNADQDSRTKTTEENHVHPFVKFLTVDECIQAINNGLYNIDKKDSKEWNDDLLSLRISIWRALNNRTQGTDNATAPIKELNDANADIKKIYDNNCRQILSLSKEDSDANLIMQAEIHRNLGEFDKCKDLLGEIKQPEKYNPYILAISAACEAKNTFTVKIK